MFSSLSRMLLLSASLAVAATGVSAAPAPADGARLEKSAASAAAPMVLAQRADDRERGERRDRRGGDRGESRDDRGGDRDRDGRRGDDRRGDDRDRDGRRGDDRRGDDRRWRDVCSPRDALRKADRMGVNRAYIDRANRRFVEVDGRRRGRAVSVRFANERGCPVIRIR